MKKRIFIVLFFLMYLNSVGQKLFLKIYGENEKSLKTIDSIGYNKSFSNAKLVVEEVTNFSKKLAQNGFIESEVVDNGKLNDSTFFYNYSVGKRTKFIHIYIGRKLGEFLEVKTDSIVLPFTDSESFLKVTLKKLEVKGFSLAKVKLINLKKQNGIVSADLNLEYGDKRSVNDIVINGYDKFSEGHKQNIKRLYRNKVFNLQNLEKVNKDFEQFRFVKQTKYPEILFTKDSTKIYVYLEKTKANTFDGFLGFNNDESNNVVFTGYLDLSLQNILNSGEKIALYWKSDGQDQKTFNLGIELPYIFKSPIGLKADRKSVV